MQKLSESENVYNYKNYSLVFLVDRNIDLASIFLHPWQYGALIHDLLRIENNKVMTNNKIPESK